MSQQYWNSTTLTHSYSLRHWFISASCNDYECNVDIKLIKIRNMFDSNSYSLRFKDLKNTYNTHKWFEWLESLKFSLFCCCIYKKRKKNHRHQAKQTHYLLVSIVVFVPESYLFCNFFVYVESWRAEIKNIMHIVKYELDEYFKLWLWELWL